MDHFRELEVARFLEKNSLYASSHDLRIPCDCSNRRPDLIFPGQSESFYVVVEVDENQHKDRQKSCEEARMVEIYNSFGGAGVLFIRYNPDSYTDSEGIRRKQSKADKKHLVDTLKQVLLFKPFSGIKVLYMYYDDYDFGKDEFKTMLVDTGTAVFSPWTPVLNNDQ
jgi:very-short-patch-repair endonuclease